MPWNADEKLAEPVRTREVGSRQRIRIAPGGAVSYDDERGEAAYREARGIFQCGRSRRGAYELSESRAALVRISHSPWREHRAGNLLSLPQRRPEILYASAYNTKRAATPRRIASTSPGEDEMSRWPAFRAVSVLCTAPAFAHHGPAPSNWASRSRSPASSRASTSSIRTHGCTSKSVTPAVV